MFQRHAREGQMKKIDDPELHIPLLKAIYPDVRKINRRKLVDNLDFKFQKMVKEPPVSSTRKLRFNNVKAESTDSSFLKGRALEGASSEAKAVKKLSFNLISPTVHSGFSFSIIHFLSAIRIAMINSHAEKNGLSFRKSLGESSSVRGACNSKRTEKKNLLQCLTIHEIVEHVRSNPGDPHVLEARETLQDLIRGALIIFSSALGAKGWKALTSYDKSSKHWSWIGPISSRQDNAIKEEISPEAWGLPHRMMVKLVDAYANWLKSVEETLKLIRSLPTPPLTYLYSAGDVEERLKGVRPRKCVATISPCCAEVRAYFHKEEALRYMVPERAFSYTALDGRKSTVSPLRRCSGKPSLKTRDHFMLKSNRPPHFTVLCLVRDAAARLPASIGTRTDVCILVRDSQYIVEDISDEQVNQVVSGALDRLHYEKDPCVQFDRDTKFWIYLHREREEEDF
ncbi:hypothetical protein CFOL_v3_08517 [Cephalotus follicularis]|uniref:Nuclear factor related to kappa-B-binding protein second winged helix domain-containing protein n=1 Tax=Cephalotus follicularis TaxID=3775 RepID=A0A1Q3BB20_CEPFO|nr:hypothetical protein CFOL_v3_08517 [Cephalotus follicularis]